MAGLWKRILGWIDDYFSEESQVQRLQKRTRLTRERANLAEQRARLEKAEAKKDRARRGQGGDIMTDFGKMFR